MHVDADAHVLEPAELWAERMDRDRWGDWIPRYLPEDSDGYESWYVGGVRRAAGTGIFGCAAGYDPEELVSRPWRYTEGHAAAWDPVERVRVLDDEGIDTCVLYPSLALLFGPLDPIPAVRDPRFVLDCQRAYNDWVADYCAVAPDRLSAMATVPIQDVDLAVTETRRTITERDLRGIVLRSAAPAVDRPFNHPCYDELWALCQDLDVPVALHPATHVDFANAVRLFDLISREANISINNRGTDELHGGGAISHAVGAPVDAIVSMGRLILGGVCERFPRLRFLFLEAGGGWVPSILHAMDEEIHARPTERKWLSMLPSEYFQRQCWVSFAPDDPTLAPSVDLLGAERILWASDFPHLDAVYPGATRALDVSLAKLPDHERDRIAGANAVAAYGSAR